MTALSKFVRQTLGFELLTANCHEYCHTWNPNCNLAVWDAVKDGFPFCLKTYTTFYLLSNLIRKKDPRKIDYKKLIDDVLRSSIFLTMNMFWFVFLVCRQRHLLGFATWPTISFINGFASSFLAIILEKKKRRPMLALYLTNLASETVYRQLVYHGYLKFIPNGQCLLFAVGLFGFLYLYRANKLDKELGSILNLTHKLDVKDDVLPLRRIPNFLQQLYVYLRQHKSGKHELCQHKHTCLSNVAESTSRNFGIGMMISVCLATVKSIRKPSTLLKNIFTLSNLKLPAFFASMPLLYHSSKCLMHRALNKDTPWVAATSGFISGASMLFYPSTSIALYIFWKCVEVYYMKLVEKGYIPSIPHGDILLYTISTGYVLGNAFIEPQTLRKGYYQFLCGLTGNRVNMLNRRLFNKFGFDSNRLFEDYIPNIDLKTATMNPALYMPLQPLK